MLRIFKGEGMQIKMDQNSVASIRMTLLQRSLHEDVGKAEPCTLKLGTETGAASAESVWKILKDYQVEMLHDPALPLSGDVLVSRGTNTSHQALCDTVPNTQGVASTRCSGSLSICMFVGASCLRIQT